MKIQSIIIDIDNGNDQLEAGNYHSLITKVANKPIIVHQIERLKNSGVESIKLITDQILPKELRNGERWDIDYKIQSTLTLDSQTGNEDQAYLIIFGNILMDFDPTRFINDWLATGDDYGIAQPLQDHSSPVTPYFYPILLTGKTLDRLLSGFDFFSPQDILRALTYLDITPATFNYDYSVYDILTPSLS